MTGSTGKDVEVINQQQPGLTDAFWDLEERERRSSFAKREEVFYFTENVKAQHSPQSACLKKKRKKKGPYITSSHFETTRLQSDLSSSVVSAFWSRKMSPDTRLLLDCPTLAVHSLASPIVPSIGSVLTKWTALSIEKTCNQWHRKVITLHVLFLGFHVLIGTAFANAPGVVFPP